jgi:hypothetical protein
VDAKGIGGLSFRCPTAFRNLLETQFFVQGMLQRATLTNVSKDLSVVQLGWTAYFPLPFGNFEFSSVTNPNGLSLGILTIPGLGVISIQTKGVLSVTRISASVVKLTTYYFASIPFGCTRIVDFKLHFKL